MMRLIVFSEKVTLRLKYILEQVCVNILELPYILTTDEDEFKRSALLKINYSCRKIADSLQIVPYSILFEKSLSRHCIEDVFVWEDYPCFFRTGGDIPFDLFAASFFLITRYEEYGFDDWDKHGRYRSSESVAYKHHFLHRPLVDLWAFKLREMLALKDSLPPIARKFEFMPTIDVDNYYRYRNRNLFWTIAVLCKNLLTGEWEVLKNRILTLFRIEKDPYFNFYEIMDLHNRYAMQPIFFFHVGRQGRYDKCGLVVPNHPRYRTIVRKMSRVVETGIHPSYQNAFELGGVKAELTGMEKLVGRRVRLNRFHYLRFRLPQSYRMLLELGIEKDFSMLYSDAVGFRASTSIPFYFYDLENDVKTDLQVFPAALMDTALRDYLKETPKNAFLLSVDMMKEVIEVKGRFMTVFHNERLTREKRDTHWIKMYKSVLRYVREYEGYKK